MQVIYEDDCGKIGIEAFVRAPFPKKLLSIVERPLERVLSLSELNRIYSGIPKCDRDLFPQKALDALKIRYELGEDDVANIPSNGPSVVVANHPFGAAEGMILAAALRSVRDDVKILANYMLGTIKEMRGMLISVDPYGGRDSISSNIKPIKEAVRWVKSGGMLVIFPAGEVSRVNLKRKEVSDTQWNPAVARIIRNTGASALPVYFGGRNGALFHLLGLLHPALRRPLLGRELLNKRDTVIRMSVGSPIINERLVSFGTDEEMTRYLRMRTYALKNRHRMERRGARPQMLEPVAGQGNKSLLAYEVGRLRPERRLVEGPEFDVYMARAAEIPYLIKEIGRLRELTFRKAGEGTGRSVDLDLFDERYIHLFVWNKKTDEVAGAYRLGLIDDILRLRGCEGLYTNTLFDYDKELFEKLGPAIELGRSFVRPEYQKGSALALLWKGIGHFVARHPRYKNLFGPVSINDDYHPVSKDVMVSFLGEKLFLPGLAAHARARNPYRMSSSLWKEINGLALADMEEVSGLVSDIEHDRKGVPVLLRQYARLGGRVLGFNVDPAFSNVLDALILVDLAATEGRLLERYMGRGGAASFLEFHNAIATPAEDLATAN